jgi:hypothetical protein
MYVHYASLVDKYLMHIGIAMQHLVSNIKVGNRNVYS